MKAVIYARYSSDNQREESIEGQIRENAAYAKKNGIEIVGQYIDRAFSAKTDNRPEFQRMIKDSADQKFDAVLVWKLDRFARNRYDSAFYKSALKKNGVKVISATEAISEGADGILLESILEGFAEYYSAELSEKVKRGMKENALKCRYNGRTVPFGYAVNAECHYELDETKAPFIKEIFEKYAAGSSSKEIIEWLNQNGVKTAKGNSFNSNSLHSIFRNRMYIGEYHFGDVVIPGGVPAVISEDLYKRVKERRAANRHSPAHNKTKDKYILSSKLFCGDCMSTMIGESGKKGETIYRYYKCGSAKNRKGCKRKPVKKDWIEDYVIGKLVEIINNRVAIDRLADIMIQKLDKENVMIDVLKSRLNEVRKAKGNILKAIEQGIITKTTKVRLTELEAEEEKIEADITHEESRASKYSKDKIVFALEKFRNLDLKVERNRERLVNALLVAVILYDDRIVITTPIDGEPITVVTKDDVQSIADAADRQLNKSSDILSCASP